MAAAFRNDFDSSTSDSTEVSTGFSARPLPPNPDSCCGSDCNPCILDIYDEELRLWQLREISKSLQSYRLGLSPDNYIECTVNDITRVTPDTAIYCLGFDKQLKVVLSVGQHVILKAASLIRSYSVTRQYTPTSPLTTIAYMELLIKSYSNGQMSHLVNTWTLGTKLAIRGPFGDYKYQRNLFKFIVMIACGTGITPMQQIIRQVVDDEADNTRITLLYGVRTSKDILLKESLDLYSCYWNISIIYALSQENSSTSSIIRYEDSTHIGRINYTLLKDIMQPFSDCASLQILICGTKQFNIDIKDILINKLLFHESVIKVF